MAEDTPPTSAATEPLDSITVINGGVEHDVHFLAKGKPSETVLVKLVPISKIGQYLTSAGDMAKLVELCCGKDAGWADTVDDDSLFAIDTLARKINDPRVGRWLTRQKAAVEGLRDPIAKSTGLMTTLASQLPVGSEAGKP